MRTRFLLFAFASLLYLKCSAQQTAIGNIGKQPIDNSFLKSIQTIWPEFTFVYDTTALKTIFQKIYSINRTAADEANANLPQADSMFLQIEQAKQLLEIKMLGEYYLQKQLDAVSVSDVEARDYYNNHKGQYSALATASYFKIYVADTSKQTIATVKKLVDERKNLTGTALQGSGEKTEGLSLSHESSVLTAMNKDLQHVFSVAAIGKISAAKFNEDNKSYIIYYLLEYTPERTRSFEEVKTACIDDVKNIKRQQLRDKFQEEAQKKYPVQLNPAFFYGSGSQYEIK